MRPLLPALLLCLGLALACGGGKSDVVCTTSDGTPCHPSTHTDTGDECVCVEAGEDIGDTGEALDETAPSCVLSIEPPESAAGEPVLLLGSVSDDASVFDALSVTLTSDLDGTLPLTLEADGSFYTELTQLSVGAHTVSLTATDEAGNACTDDATVEVCDAVWHEDSDADGFGDPDAVTTACQAPAGYVADATDCDDADAAINLDAPERCDKVDNDCDGETDEDDASDASTWYADTDGDGYGDADTSTDACEQPGGYVTDATDCDDSNADASPGSTEVCDEADNDCDGEIDEGVKTTFYADNDGDGYGDAGSGADACEAPPGYVADATDCDDAESRSSPGETEVCDEVDNDCDGETDEDDASDASTWYADTDGDGFGDAADSTDACEQPGGYVADATDCDDSNADASPGSTEICDEADNDCDGEIDEGVKTTFYADNDGDGYGNADVMAEACSAPSGYVADDTDCDDAESAASPGETEVCDEVDNDCDGETDEEVTDAFYADDDGDGYGDAADSTEACSAPDGYVTDNTDCDDSAPAVYPGAVELCGDGLLNGCDAAPADIFGECGVSGEIDLADADVVFSGADSGDYAGTSVAGVGDIDGDGLADTLIGASNTTNGTAYLILGGVSGAVSLADADVTFTGESSGDRAGHWTAGAGDLDGDGYGDLFIGAYGVDNGGYTYSGAVYIALGLTSGAVSLSDAHARIIGDSDSPLSAVAAAGDIDGDGLSDLLIGSASYDDTYSNMGAAFVFFGTASGALDLSDADINLLGDTSSEFIGRSVDGADIDGDGLSDLLIGTDDNEDGGSHAGAVYVVLGGVSGTLAPADADAMILGEENANLGAEDSLSGIGDADGDGLDDILLGAVVENDAGDFVGGAWLMLGGLSGSVSLSDAQARLISGDHLGFGVVTGDAGDVDGDGLSDLLIDTDDDTELTGGAYLVSGTVSGTVTLADDALAKFLGEDTYTYTGMAMDGAGDANGDGLSDVLISARGAGSSSEGRIYLVFSAEL